MANTKPVLPTHDVADTINSVMNQFVADAPLADTDLSNLSEIGKAYEALPTEQRRIVTSGMVSLVTQQITDVRVFNSSPVDIIRSRSSYDEARNGIIQKNRPHLIDAVSDIDAYDPEPGSSSDPFVNHAINTETDYYANRFAWRHEWSQPERWMSGLFLSQNNLNNFLSGVQQQVRNSMELNLEALTNAALRSSIAHDLATATDLKVGGQQAINLLAEYKKSNPDSTLTAASAMSDPNFMRFAVFVIWRELDGLTGSASALYNNKHIVQSSNMDTIQIALLSQFQRGFEQFLLSDVFHDNYLTLPTASRVNFWKSPAASKTTRPDFMSASTVMDTVTNAAGTKKKINQSGVVAHVFDREHIGIYNLGTKETSQYDPVALKENHFLHVAGQSIIDPYHNSLTFYIADPAADPAGE